MMGIPLEKCHSNIQKYGNCSAASIPILLSECVDNNVVKKVIQYLWLHLEQASRGLVE